MRNFQLMMGQPQSNFVGTGPKTLRIYVLLALLAIVVGYAAVSTIYAGSWHVPKQAANWHNPVPAGANREAHELYADKCAHCHGEAGRGDGSDARNYDPRPTNFTDPSISKEPDGVLFFKMSEGKRPMPSFRRKLSERQRWELVTLIRSFADAAHPAK
jgi:mono/diheme cytochrome c family protein